MVLGKKGGRPGRIEKRRQKVAPYNSDVAKGILETDGGKYAYKL